MRKTKHLNRIVSAIMTIVFTMLAVFNGWSNFNVSAATYNVIFPVNNGIKIYRYQKYDPRYKNHDGVDIHSSGDDTIYAAKAGTVVGTCNSCPHTDELEEHRAGKYEEQGNYIEIKGTDGIYYWYYHLKQNTLLVSKGDKVSAGQAIATMGSSGQSTGKHLHFRMTTGSGYYSDAIIANPVGTYSGQVNYSNGPYGKIADPYTPYDAVSNGNYYFKNVSTGTYLTVDGAKVANGQNLSVAAKKDTNAFKFGVSGSASTSYAFTTLLNTGYVVNPYSDTPGNGTNVTLYQKTGDSSQLFRFKKVADNTYIIHNVYDYNQVLGVNGTNVQLQTRTAKDTQKWVLEDVNAATLSKIAVTAKPTKQTYYVGSAFDQTGLQVTATYSDNSTKNVTGKITAKYDFSKAGSTIVTFYYTENGKTELASITVTVQEIPSDVFAGSGTEDDPYQISSREELIKMRDLVNDTELNPQYGHAYYIQTADIDLEHMEWMPIGVGYDGEKADGAYNYKTRMFFGSYDGNSHYIKNLKVTADLHSAGLFGFLKSNGNPGIVKNLVVTGEIASTEACGGVIGQMQYGASVENCAFIGNITGKNVGGITGTVWNGGTVTGCYHTGTLTGTDYAAGISPTVWFNNNESNTKHTVISNCYHADGIITSNKTGAIVSDIQRTSADDSKVTLVNCFAATTSAAGTNPEGVNSDTTLLKTNSEMRMIAEDLGTPFEYNAKDDLNGGYPVFAWQLEETIYKGDINEDHVADVLDVVLLQEWILAVPDAALPNCWAADMNEDGVVDVFDLALLKRLLIGG